MNNDMNMKFFEQMINNCTCPVTLHVMSKPVLLTNSDVVVEYDTYNMLMSNGNDCPITRKKITGGIFCTQTRKNVSLLREFKLIKKHDMFFYNENIKTHGERILNDDRFLTLKERLENIYVDIEEIFDLYIYYNFVILDIKITNDTFKEFLSTIFAESKHNMKSYKYIVRYMFSMLNMKPESDEIKQTIVNICTTERINILLNFLLDVGMKIDKLYTIDILWAKKNLGIENFPLDIIVGCDNFTVEQCIDFFDGDILNVDHKVMYYKINNKSFISLLFERADKSTNVDDVNIVIDVITCSLRNNLINMDTKVDHNEMEMDLKSRLILSNHIFYKIFQNLYINTYDTKLTTREFNMTMKDNTDLDNKQYKFYKKQHKQHKQHKQNKQHKKNINEKTKTTMLNEQNKRTFQKYKRIQRKNKSINN